MGAKLLSGALHGFFDMDVSTPGGRNVVAMMNFDARHDGRFSACHGVTAILQFIGWAAQAGRLTAMLRRRIQAKQAATGQYGRIASSPIDACRERQRAERAPAMPKTTDHP